MKREHQQGGVGKVSDSEALSAMARVHVIKRCLHLLLPLLWIGCSVVTDDVHVQEELLNGITVVTSRGAPPVVGINQVEVLWQGPELEEPHSIIDIDRALVIADRSRIHILSLVTGGLRSIGRRGQGPAEFGLVAGVSRLADTLVVMDVRLLRLSHLSLEGDLLRSHGVQPPAPYGETAAVGMIPFVDGAELVWAWRESIQQPGRPMQVALVAHDLETGASRVLERLDDLEWRELGSGQLVPARPFGPRANVAIGSDGRIAFGDGIDYCLDLRRLSVGEERRICRDRERVRAGRGVGNPDFDLVPTDAQREVLREVVRNQEIPDRLPSFDRIRLMNDELWVRTMGPEVASVHPWLRAWVPELEPEFRRWNVFDANGRLLRTLELSAQFDPWVTDREDVFGLLELGTGEIVVARGRLTGR